MNLQEKNLYQQIHPLRLATDWLTGFIACYLCWLHEIIFAIIIAFLPSLVISLLVIKTADLEKIKNSAFGKYYQQTYTKTVDLIRFGGFIVMCASAWYYYPEGIIVGLTIIIATWTYGIFFRRKNNE